MVNSTSRALNVLVTASKQTPRQRNNVEVSLALTTVETRAKEEGLSADQILTLVDLGASRKFSEAVSSKLIKAMIPSTVVPEQAVLNAISWMCTNTPSINIQTLLIRWINLVYDSIETRQRLSKLYGILFYFLDSDTLMPHVCHLLYRLTQKEDIRMFRVRHLLNLHATLSAPPYLMALLSLYKLFYPNLVTMAIPRHKVFFRSTDRVWAASIRKVREKNRTLEEVAVNMDTTRLHPDRSFVNPSQAGKRARLEIPAVTASTSMEERADSHAHTSLHLPPVPFTHIKDFAHLVDNLDRVEMPGQIAAVLENPLLQHAVSCHHSPITAARFNMWLQHTLLEEFINSPDVTESKQKEQLLHVIIEYSSFLQEGIPACERFLAGFLSVWNGEDFRPQVFALIAKHQMELLCCGVASVWLHQTSGGPVYKRGQEIESMEGLDGLDTIRRLIGYVDEVCSIALLLDRNNQLLVHFILNFYEQVCQLNVYGVPFISMPSPTFVYQMLFGPSAMTVSRLCGILCFYKSMSDYVNANLCEVNRQAEELGVSNIKELNVYIEDTAHCLWQYKAFQRPISGLFIKSQPLASLGIHHLSECFSIHSHQALVGYALQFLDETQPEGAVVHPNSIKASVKTKQIYLKYLQQASLKGLVDFIHTFVHSKPALK